MANKWHLRGRGTVGIPNFIFIEIRRKARRTLETSRQVGLNVC